MRNIILSLIILVSLMWSCEDMYDKQAKYEGELVYPAKFDTIIGHIGFERVEIDLIKAGRLPSSQIKLGKAQKTKIEYEDKVITIDSLVSFVNITGLTQSKLYRFKVYTIDEFGNESVSQETALIPFTSTDLASFAITPPRVMASPSAAIVEWPSGISSVLLDYYSLTYEYTDKDGVLRTGERGLDPRFFVGNIEAGQSVDIKMHYKIVPKINREPILDTVIFTDKLVLNMPTGSSGFPVTERDILLANGITTFTADGVSDIEKLSYPVHANSIQDIFYFSNLKELDLTGGALFKLPELKYDRNGVVDYVGGGEFAPFMRKAGNIAPGNRQALKDFLEAGIIEKVYYRPNSMGLDDLLLPYVDEGVVELVEAPNSVLVDNQFHLNGVVQAHEWNMDISYPATDVPEGDGLEHVYKTTCREKNASFVFALPKEYQFNIDEYKYLKMKVYAPDKSALSGNYSPYQLIWPRFMNSMWSFGGNTNFGQEYWDHAHVRIEDEQLQKWTDVTIDLSEALDKHNRVIVLNIGGEPSIGSWSPPVDITYYFANIRFEKE